MDNLPDPDLAKIKSLLRHTGEFIAYFEIAEAKMITWQQELEAQIQLQEKKINHQLQNLQQEIEPLHEALTQAGIARLKLSLEQAQREGEEHIALLKKTGQSLLDSMKAQQQEISTMISSGLNQIDQFILQALKEMNQQLADYDINHFKRVANESCIHVEKVATSTMRKSSGLLKVFQWRSIALALLSTFITAFVISLYVSSEMPWESHQHALNERQVGRALIKIWPELSQQEQDKILAGYRLRRS